jgi:hypothetical protein
VNEVLTTRAAEADRLLRECLQLINSFDIDDYLIDSERQTLNAIAKHLEGRG